MSATEAGRGHRLAWMRRVSAVAAAILTTGCSSDSAHKDTTPPNDTTSARVLLIGWDGATFDLIDPLLAAGRLPNVHALLERGASANLESTRIPISSAAWAAIVTGKNPGKTGVYSFLEPIPGTYDARIISSRSNRASPLWRILSRRGLGVHVFGVPVTYPPEPVHGRMVAGMLSPFDATYAYPADYTDELRSAGFIPDLGIWRTEEVADAATLTRQLDLKADAVVDLLSRDDWALSVVVFKSLDVLCHRTYDGDPNGVVADLCVRLDEILGRMLETVGTDTNVFLISDHGFRVYEYGFNLNEWLIQEGFAVRHTKTGATGRASGPLVDRRQTAHSERLGALDMNQTRAFALAAEGNFGALRLNLSGREPNGIVSAEDADALLSEITARLLETRNENDDEWDSPLFPATFRGPELYPGPYQEVVPDLIVEADPRLRMLAKNRRQVLLPYAKGSPDHALDGVLIAAGPQIRGDGDRTRASVVDLAPTVLHILGLPTYEEMDGRSLSGLLTELGDAQIIPENTDPNSGPAAGAAPTELNESEQQELEDRLRSLGYAN